MVDAGFYCSKRHVPVPRDDDYDDDLGTDHDGASPVVYPDQVHPVTIGQVCFQSARAFLEDSIIFLEHEVFGQPLEDGTGLIRLLVQE